MYVVCSKSITNFEFLRVMYTRFSIFCSVMLVLIFIIYADKFCHFEYSVNFWQLGRVLARLRILLVQFREHEKVTRSRSGEYGGCGNIIVLFLGKNSRTSNDVWVGAQSWCKSQFLFFHKSGRFWRIASRKLRITCR